LEVYPSTDNFLDTHTKLDEGSAFATTRNSTQVAFRWQSNLSKFPEVVEKIEEHCQEAMQLWGYLPVIYNQTGLNDNASNYTVLADPPWPEMTVPRGNASLWNVKTEYDSMLTAYIFVFL
jgi:hypothetical protein